MEAKELIQLTVLRIRLERGLLKLKAHAHRGRAARFFSLVACRRALRAWRGHCLERRGYGETKRHVTPLPPHYSGSLVFACFKWFSATLGRTNPVYPLVVIHDRAGERIRSYVNGRMELGALRLFVHSLAVLDSHCLRLAMCAWHLGALASARDRSSVILHFWAKWRLFAKSSGAAFKRVCTLLLISGRYATCRTWLAWRMAFRISRHRLPITRRLMQKACLGWKVVTNRRVHLSRKKESAHAYYTVWVLQASFSQWRHFRLHWSLQTSGLAAPPSSSDPSCIEYKRRLRKSVKMLQNFAAFRVAQRMLCGCGTTHHLRRLKFTLLPLQRVGMGFVIRGPRESSRVPPPSLPASFIITARFLKTWRAFTETCTHLHYAQTTIKAAVWEKLQAAAFGTWMLLYSRNKRIVFAQRKLHGAIFRRTLWLAWFAWRHLFERSTPMRSVRRNNGDIISDRPKIVEPRSIGKVAWNMHRGHMIVSRMRKACDHTLQQRFWIRWKVVNAAHAMAIWIQSLFRGFQVRKLILPSVRSHVVWFASKASDWVALVRRRLLKTVMAVFLAHHRFVENKFNHFVTSKSARRCLRRLRCTGMKMSRNRNLEARGRKIHRLTAGKALMQQLRIMLVSNVAMHAAREWNKSIKAKGAVRVLKKFSISRSHRCSEALRDTTVLLLRRKQVALMRLRLWHRWLKYHRKLIRRSKKALMSKCIQNWLIFTARSTVTAKASQACSISFLGKVIRRMRIRTEIQTVLRRLSWRHYCRHRFRSILMRWVDIFQQSSSRYSDFLLALRTHEAILSRRYLGYLYAFAGRKQQLRRLTLGGVEAMRIFRLRRAFGGMHRRNLLRKIDTASVSASLALLQILTSATTRSGLRLTHVIAPQCPAASASHRRDIWSERGPGERKGRIRSADARLLCPMPMLVASRFTSLYVHAFRRIQMYNRRVHEEKQRVANARIFWGYLCFRRWRKWARFRSLEHAFFATHGMRQKLRASLAMWLTKVPQSKANGRHMSTATKNGECIRLRRALKKWAGVHFMREQLLGCARRFSLHPALFAWLHLTAESMLSRKVVREYCQRLCWKVFFAWRTVAERNARMQMAHNALCRRVQRGIQFKAVLAWMKFIDDRRALEKFQLAQLLAWRISLRRSMGMWRDAIQGKKIAEVGSAKAALSTWRLFRCRVVAQRLTGLLGHHYYCRKWLRSMRRRFRMLDNLRRRGIDCEGLILLNRCRHLCRKWARMATLRVRAATSVVNKIDVSLRKPSSSASAPLPQDLTRRNKAAPPPLWGPKTHDGGLSLSPLPPVVSGALDARCRYRQLRSAIKFWRKWLHLCYNNRLRTFIFAWGTQARRLRQARNAFTMRISVLLDNTRVRFCFDVLRAFFHSRQVETTCAKYLLLVQKSKLLHFWLFLLRRRRTERYVLSKALNSLSRRWRADYLRHWRVAAGPRVKIERVQLVRHVLGCWSRHTKALRHCRRRVLQRVVGGWCYVFDKLQIRAGILRARRVINVFISIVETQRRKLLSRAFAELCAFGILNASGKLTKDPHARDMWHHNLQLIRSADTGGISRE